jgi:diguanylate cyclase (GGDEF)-like protein
LPFAAASSDDSSKLISEKLKEQLDLIGEALDASQDGFAIWKAVLKPQSKVADFELVFINRAGAAAEGKSPAQLIGCGLEKVVGPLATKGLFPLFSKALETQKTIRDTLLVSSPQGWAGAFENTVVPLGNGQLLSTYRDVSEERREHGRLVWLSEHDYLTGMPNRAKLQSYLSESIELASVDGTLLAFVFIDIDYFKNVNDELGHDIGDVLLVNFIKRIRNSLPESSLVARIAGDEFAIVLRNVKSVEHLSELMNEVFNSMKRQFSHGDVFLSITCSAGCLITDGSERPEEVMRIADRAMYRAKHEGRNRFLVETKLKTI